MTTHDTEGRGGGAMDKLKNAWREATGAPQREDEVPGQRTPEHDGQQTGPGSEQVPGSARNADVHPEEAARQGSGLDPAGRQAADTWEQRGRVDARPGQQPPPQMQAGQAPPQQSAPQQAGLQHTAPPQAGPPQAGPYQNGPQQNGPQQSGSHLDGSQAVPPQAGGPRPAPQPGAQQPGTQQPGGQQPGQQGFPARQDADQPTTATPLHPGAALSGQSSRQPGDGQSHLTGQGQGTRDGDARPDTERGHGETGHGDTDAGRHQLFDDRRGPEQRDDHRGSDQRHDGAGAGSAAAAGVAGAAARHEPGDRDRDDDDRTVATPTAGTSTAGSGTVGSNAGTSSTGGSGTSDTATTTGSEPDSERLIPGERAQSYASRWDAVKGEFVDEPREAVRKADSLVGEVLEDLQRAFTHQRSTLEHGLDADETSTEDLRQALHRYRKFFDRLLKL